MSLRIYHVHFKTLSDVTSILKSLTEITQNKLMSKFWFLFASNTQFTVNNAAFPLCWTFLNDDTGVTQIWGLAPKSCGSAGIIMHIKKIYRTYFPNQEDLQGFSHQSNRSARNTVHANIMYLEESTGIKISTFWETNGGWGCGS